MTDWQQQQQQAEEAGGSPQKGKTPLTSCTPGRGSPTLLRALRNKRDSLRCQLSQLHKNLSGFKLQRFQKKVPPPPPPPPPAKSGDGGTPADGDPGSAKNVKEEEKVDKEVRVEEGVNAEKVSSEKEGCRTSGEGDSCLLCVGGDGLVCAAACPLCASVKSGAGDLTVTLRGRESEVGHGLQSEASLTMTVRGEKCGDDSGSVPGAGQSGSESGGHAHGSTAGCTKNSNTTALHTSGASTDVSQHHKPDSDLSQQRSQIDKTSEADDELPLGSEANSLGHRQERRENGLGRQGPVDKRLLSVRQWGVGSESSALLLHSGWTSFNSDVSNITSGSATSASSVDLLLRSRQVDSEQVLINLGFGGSLASSSASHMYSRIPQRFLLSQQSQGSQSLDEDGLPETLSGEGTPNSRSPLRGQCPGYEAECLDSQYYTYVLNRVPAYFFKEKAPSEQSSCSASSDGEDLPALDDVERPFPEQPPPLVWSPPPQGQPYQERRPHLQREPSQASAHILEQQECAGFQGHLHQEHTPHLRGYPYQGPPHLQGHPGGLKPPMMYEGYPEFPERFYQGYPRYQEQLAHSDSAGLGLSHGTTHRLNPHSSLPDNGKKAPDSVCGDHLPGDRVGQDGHVCPLRTEEFSVEFRPPDEDNLSSSSDSSAEDEVTFPYRVRLSPNESLV